MRIAHNLAWYDRAWYIYQLDYTKKKAWFGVKQPHSKQWTRFFPSVQKNASRKKQLTDDGFYDRLARDGQWMQLMSCMKNYENLASSKHWSSFADQSIEAIVVNLLVGLLFFQTEDKICLSHLLLLRMSKKKRAAATVVVVFVVVRMKISLKSDQIKVNGHDTTSCIYKLAHGEYENMNK